MCVRCVFISFRTLGRPGKTIKIKETTKRLTKSLPNATNKKNENSNIMSL